MFFRGLSEPKTYFSPFVIGNNDFASCIVLLHHLICCNPHARCFGIRSLPPLQDRAVFQHVSTAMSPFIALGCVGVFFLFDFFETFALQPTSGIRLLCCSRLSLCCFRTTPTRFTKLTLDASHAAASKKMMARSTL